MSSSTTSRTSNDKNENDAEPDLAAVASGEDRGTGARREPDRLSATTTTPPELGQTKSRPMPRTGVSALRASRGLAHSLITVTMGGGAGGDDDLYPHATTKGLEHNVDAKPRQQNRANRLIQFYLRCALLIVVAAVIGILIGFRAKLTNRSPVVPTMAPTSLHPSQATTAPVALGPSQQPSMAPVALRKSQPNKSLVTSRQGQPNKTPVAPRQSQPNKAPVALRQDQLLSVFARATGVANISQMSASQLLAADWMLDTDPMMLTTNSSNLEQRYILALFYYQMSQNGQSPWRSCNPPVGDEGDQCTFYERTLDTLKDGSEGVVYIPKQGYHRWLSGVDECTWAGIFCDETKSVVGIELFDQNLTGTLPTEIASLSLLESFSVPFNTIIGTIPDEYTSFSLLLQLELHYNLLTGRFSDEWYQITDLLNLNIGGNMLSGSLSTELGLLSNLKGLHLFENSFTGAIPTEIGNLNSLCNLRLNDNLFEGQIPAEIGQLQDLEEFWLFDNRLTGTIPSEIGLLANLTDLRLNNNNISGTIPEEFWNMTNLQVDLELEDMNLTGTLSTRIGELTNLNVFLIRRNYLTGTIPTELALLTNLQAAWLHLNNFTGPVPSELCNNRGSASQYDLEFLNADCGPAIDPTQPCSCCTACCDRSTSVCLLVE